MTLQRNTPMKRGKPLHSVSARREAEARDAGVRLVSTFKPRVEWAKWDRQPLAPSRPRAAVPNGTRLRLAVRSEGVCEIQFEGCTWWATDPSHRDGRGMGGRHREAAKENSRLSNVVHSCRHCHRWLHEHVARAEAMGLMLRTGQEPSTTPLLYRGRRCLLDDLGGVFIVAEVSA